MHVMERIPCARGRWINNLFILSHFPVTRNRIRILIFRNLLIHIESKLLCFFLLAGRQLVFKIVLIIPNFISFYTILIFLNNYFKI